MNNIISQSRLADLIARASSKDQALCERFVAAFAKEAADALAAGGPLKLKGFGQFKVGESDGVRSVIFIPDRELAEAANALFACFDPVELAQDVSEEELVVADDPESPAELMASPLSSDPEESEAGESEGEEPAGLESVPEESDESVVEDSSGGSAENVGVESVTDDSPDDSDGDDPYASVAEDSVEDPSADGVGGNSPEEDDTPGPAEDSGGDSHDADADMRRDGEDVSSPEITVIDFGIDAIDDEPDLAAADEDSEDDSAPYSATSGDEAHVDVAAEAAEPIADTEADDIPDEPSAAETDEQNPEDTPGLSHDEARNLIKEFQSDILNESTSDETSVGELSEISEESRVDEISMEISPAVDAADISDHHQPAPEADEEEDNQGERHMPPDGESGADEDYQHEAPEPMPRSSLDLLTPEARRRQSAHSSGRKHPGGFPWFWVAIAYIGGMAIGFGLGFFGHGYITGASASGVAASTDGSASDPSIPGDEVIDLTGEEANVMVVAPDTSAATLTDTSAVVAPAEIASPGSAEAPADSTVTPQLGQPTVYDTITPNNSLTTLARKHYGNRIYWVYIFLDNQDKIKNPNNVIVGTKLRIPPKAKYDVSDTDEGANIQAAKHKESEIYAKYGVR